MANGRSGRGRGRGVLKSSLDRPNIISPFEKCPGGHSPQFATTRVVSLGGHGHLHLISGGGLRFLAVRWEPGIPMNRRCV